MTELWGVARATARMTAWGAGIHDFDNDGLKDRFASGGSIPDNEELVDRLPTRIPSLALRNANGRRFQDVSEEASLREGAERSS